MVRQKMKRKICLKKKAWHEVWKNWQEDILKNLHQILICGERVKEYRRKLRKKSGKEKAVWSCENRLRNGFTAVVIPKLLKKNCFMELYLKA